MENPKIILVTGAPATGKTTLAKKIAEKYTLPLISKDVIKEILFDTVGWSDREWSRKLGVATYHVMYYILKSQLTAGKSLVMESDFRPDFDEPKLLELKKEFPFDLFSVYCHANPDIILERFKARVDSKERHPGHVDTENYEYMKSEQLQKDFPNFTISDASHEIDTTDFESIDYDTFWNKLSNFLK